MKKIISVIIALTLITINAYAITLNEITSDFENVKIEMTGRINSVNQFSLYYKDENETSRTSIIDADGNTIIDGKDYISVFSLSKAKLYILITNDYKYQIADETGKILLDDDYFDLQFYNENLIVALKDEYYGIINLKGEVLLPFEHLSLNSAKNYIIATNKDNLYFLYDYNFNKICEPTDYETLDLNYDLSFEEYQDEYYFDDKYFDFNYSIISDDDGNFGYKDNTAGKIVIFPQYTGASNFNAEGYATVTTKDDETAIINKQNQQVLTTGYSQITNMGNGYYIVSDGEYDGVIDITGKVLIPVEYIITDYDARCGVFIAYSTKNGTCLLDHNGNIIPLNEGETPISLSGGYLTTKTENSLNIYEINESVVKVKLNKKTLFFDSEPVITDGRTLVPLRGIFEAMGATVSWNDETKTVTAVYKGITLIMTIGSKEFTVNGEKKTLDVPAQIVKSRTMVPARAVFENFGATVSWDDNNKVVIINN